jgi:hypothetical protein
MQQICTHTISLQSSKPSHAYPIIRLPREFKSLAGAKGTIFQTIYKGASAFLVVIDHPHLKEDGLGRSRNVTKRAKRSLDMAEVAGPNPAEPVVFSAFFNEITPRNVSVSSTKKLSTLGRKLSTFACSAPNQKKWTRKKLWI